MTADDTRRVVGRWIDAFNGHDVDAFGDLLAEAYEEVSPSERIVGRRAGLDGVRATFTTQPDAAIGVTAVLVDDGCAAVEYRMTGTLAAPLHFPDGRVVPATGRRYDLLGCSLVWVADGRITAVHHYWDRALMREQLGLPA